MPNPLKKHWPLFPVSEVNAHSTIVVYKCRHFYPKIPPWYGGSSRTHVSLSYKEYALLQGRGCASTPKEHRGGGEREGGNKFFQKRWPPFLVG
jgi:hypothetical protein